MEHKKFNSLINYNLDFISDSTIDPVDQMRIMLLTSFVKKICKEKDGSYYFVVDDETDENHKMLDNWTNIIMKYFPYPNRSQLRGCVKKVYIMLKHMCKYLENYGIKLNTAQIEIDQPIKITKIAHFISGL